MSVNIHGNEYITVSERVTMAHEALKALTITTEVLYQSPVVVKATVITEKGTFTGISAANPSKTIEKASPYEVAETSAIGRALGFAGYGIVNGIATADEIAKVDPTDEWPDNVDASIAENVTTNQGTVLGNCKKCGAANALSKANKVYCSAKCWLK